MDGNEETKEGKKADSGNQCSGIYSVRRFLLVLEGET